MQPTMPASVLMKIQPMILKFTKMLASVLHLEVEIVDAGLTRVAGTGPFDNSLGVCLTSNSPLLRYVIDNKKEKMVIQFHNDPLCSECDSRDSCKEKAFLGVPVIIGDNCVGVISLVAINFEQQQVIKKNVQMLCDYIRHISAIFVAKIIENSDSEIITNPFFNTLIKNMDQGVLMLNKEDAVVLSNPAAQKILDMTGNDISSFHLKLIALTPKENLERGFSQYLITLKKQQMLLTGQLLPVQDHRLFLMAFHQSHSNNIEPLNFESLDIHQLIGNSKPMSKLKQLITQIAPGHSSVLISGESGTGKEVVARAIHRLSKRGNQAFIAINCAAIPEQLLESELFGYVKGAFTGASAQGRVGLLQAANGGTLFLDEIGDMPMMLQAKLLRAIESREVTPIGASKPLPLDIRIVSATNQNLQNYIAQGKFREDLYYRLNVIPVMLAPLRERKNDVELLVHFFLNLHSVRMENSYPGMTQEVIEILNGYHWPGNVRELGNLMEYLVNIVPSGEVIERDLLPPHLISIPSFLPSQSPRLPHLQNNTLPVSSGFPEEPAGKSNLEVMEKQLIEKAMQRHRNKKLAAEELGIGVATLYRKIKKYEIHGS